MFTYIPSLLSFLRTPSAHPSRLLQSTKLSSLCSAPATVSVTYEKWRSKTVSLSVMSHSLQPRGLQPARLLCPWYSSGKNTGVGSHTLLQGSSWPRDQTQVSHIAGRFFTIWATREAHLVSICQCSSQFVLPSIMKWIVLKLLKGRYGAWFIPELNKVINLQMRRGNQEKIRRQKWQNSVTDQIYK